MQRLFCVQIYKISSYHQTKHTKKKQKCSEKRQTPRKRNNLSEAFGCRCQEPLPWQAFELGVTAFEMLFLTCSLLHFGTDSSVTAVPIGALRWYRFECYDGTDSPILSVSDIIFRKIRMPLSYIPYSYPYFHLCWANNHLYIFHLLVSYQQKMLINHI